MMDRNWVRFPLMFQNNRITRFYVGGKVLNEWRRMEEVEDSHQCEELLVTSIGAISKGQKEGFAVSRTLESQGSTLLSDLLRAYPEEILGKEFHEYNPNHLSVLARVGDTKVRLVLQCHPKRQDAKKYFGMPMGKTEAWYMARIREIPGEEACVYAGFKRHVTKALWRRLYEAQDVDAMVNCLHKLPVKQGQTVLIPAGMPHCVGPGCLFLEYHECNDITVRVEKNINGMTISDEEMFYGLSLEEGLGLFDFTTYTEEEIRQRIMMKEHPAQQEEQYELLHIIRKEDNDSFGMDLLKLHGMYRLPDKEYHRVIVAVENDLTIKVGDREECLIQGHGALIPACCKNVELIGADCQVTIGIPFLEGKEV